METAPVLLDRIFEPLCDVITPESAGKIVEWRADGKTQQRLDELGDKCNEGQLSSEERDEYDVYIRAIDFIGVLQAKARTVLHRTAHQND